MIVKAIAFTACVKPIGAELQPCGSRLLLGAGKTTDTGTTQSTATRDHAQNNARLEIP